MGLDRMRRLLSLLGNPEEKLNIFHVAGTNGKGSVATYLSSILQEAGYTVGVHTSPHVMVYNERFMINNHLISDEAFTRYGEAVLNYNEWLNQEGYGYLSEFEILTAIAYLFFADNGVDYMISEVGLGGVIDSTNTIEHPVSTVITQVGRDHTGILGDTLREIAWNKAGIIKAGIPVISESVEPETQEFIRWKAEQKGSEFLDVSDSEYKIVSRRPEMLFDVTIGEKEYRDLHLSMQGDHQVRNAVTAMMALLKACEEGKVSVSEEHIRAGLQKARIMGRFEFLQKENPAVIIDGGHNPQCIQALVKNIQDYLAGRPLTILTGVLADKDYNCMYRNVEPYAKEFITVTPGNPRALNAHDLAQYLSQFGKPVTACDAVADGVRLAVEHAGKDGVVLCYGSLYMIGEIEAGLQRL